MALSPGELINRLNEFFTGNGTLYSADYLVGQGKNPLKRAEIQRRLDELGDTMDRLAWLASFDHETRHRLAQESILEKALTGGFAGKEQDAEALGYRGSMRKSLLKRIYDAATGGAWGLGDESGLTEWLGSEFGSKAAFIQAIEGDPDPEVRALLIKILRDVALPASWFQALQERRLFDKLDVQTRESSWSQSERRAISALAAQASGRVGAEVAKLASGAFGTLPGFMTGEGADALTPPPPPKPWYRSGWSWVIASVSAIGGGTLAARGRR